VDIGGNNGRFELEPLKEHRRSDNNGVHVARKKLPIIFVYSRAFARDRFFRLLDSILENIA
jgi:hypothetical protein